SGGTPAVPRRVPSARNRNFPIRSSARALSSQTERPGVATMNKSDCRGLLATISVSFPRFGAIDTLFETQTGAAQDLAAALHLLRANGPFMHLDNHQAIFAQNVLRASKRLK